MTASLLPACLCGALAAAGETVHGIPVLRCAWCGVVRQAVSMDRERLAAWYRERYFAGVYQHAYGHDRAVAARRLAAYRLPREIRLLDVGCGNGAFVHEAESCGIDAWGQDVAAQSDGPRVYVGELTDVAFPTDAFDVVTVHDVLEHFVDPAAVLAEIRRVLRPGGKLIVDFPRFWCPEGAHHWKPIEHLWMLTEEELVELLRRAGFTVTETTTPIPSKIVVACERPPEARPQILVPAGIGDAYWALAKLPGFLRHHGFGMPDVWVQDSGGPRRTEPFIRTVASVHSAGYYRFDVRQRKRGAPPQGTSVWHEAYMQNGRTCFPQPFERIDWFVAYNGVLRAGRRLEDVDPEFGVEWRPRMHVSKAARAFMARTRIDGPYAAAYFPSSGMYANWIADFGPESIWTSLVRLRTALGLRVVMFGAEWDRGSIGDVVMRRAAGVAGWHNLIGETDYDALVGVLRGASLIVGYPSGATVLGPVWRVPTVLLWNRYFKPEFWTNACPPDAPYEAVDTAGLTPEALVAVGARTLERGA